MPTWVYIVLVSWSLLILLIVGWFHKAARNERLFEEWRDREGR